MQLRFHVFYILSPTWGAKLDKSVKLSVCPFSFSPQLPDSKLYVKRNSFLERGSIWLRIFRNCSNPVLPLLRIGIVIYPFTEPCSKPDHIIQTILLLIAKQHSILVIHYVDAYWFVQPDTFQRIRQRIICGSILFYSFYNCVTYFYILFCVWAKAGWK